MNKKIGLKNCAVVLGGYVNGYSILQELHACSVKNIALLYYRGQSARYSNKAKHKLLLEKSPKSLLNSLLLLHRDYDNLVLYPTDDLQIEYLNEIKDQIIGFCFLPFNSKNIVQVSNKKIQYKFCEELGIPYPRTIEITNIEDVDRIEQIPLPLIIKPNKREDLKIKVFRSLVVRKKNEIIKYKDTLRYFLDAGLTFIASEIVPGDSNGSIYGYVGYRSPKNGKILNEWTGKKLTQYPDDYGVFSSSTNEAPDVIKEQGRILLEGMDLFGICEPEFKYDSRDRKYKLMEINMRSMMWHRTGMLSGVNIQYTQWLDALSEETEKYEQQKSNIHFVYLKHEIGNLLYRKAYWKHFKHNVFGGELTFLAFYDKNDIFPFITDQAHTVKELARRLAKKLLR